MDNQQNLESQSSKDRAWTTDEIRKHSSNWTLAGDVGLYNLLNEFSQQIIARTHEVENAVDSLVHETKMTTAKINNVINDFHMLSNLQFVENRVYDEEIQEPSTENKPVPEKTKEQREAEMLPKILKAVELGLSVLDTAFDRINVNEISDSEDEEDISSEGRIILEPKDPYEHRPLPYIIGSAEFMKCDYAGLKDLIEEEAPSFSEESGISETDESSSDEGEPLPLDDDKFSAKPNGLIAQNMVDQVSSSDESELFGSEKEVNGFGSESSLEVKEKEKNIQKSVPEAQPVKEVRQGSVASIQSKLKLPQVLPVPNFQEKKENDDLFASEEHSDDESPFRKRTGLFTSDVRFDDEKDEDLFGGDLFGKSPSKDVQPVKPKEVPKVKPEKPKSIVPEAKQPALFGSDEESEDDIFETLMTKRTSIAKASNAGSQDSSDKADTLSTPSSAPSTKPSGNAFDFATGGGNNDSLFADDSDGDDLFSNKKSQGKRIDFDSSENDDLFGIVPIKTPKEPKESKKVEPEKSQMPKEKIFSSKDNSFAQEKTVKSPASAKSPLSIPAQSKKEISLFDDDDDDSEEDIFSKVSKGSKLPTTAEKSKSAGLFEDSEEVVKESKVLTLSEKSKSSNLFEDSVKVTPKEAKPEKSLEKTRTLSLFDDTEEEIDSILPNVPKTQQSKSSSLFDDTDSYDLFAPKPSVRQSVPTKSVVEPTKSVTERTKPVIEPTKPVIETTKPVIESTKPVIESTKPPSVPIAETKVPKIKDEISSLTKEASNEDQVSFDTPIDSSKVLNVISKGRVKVTAKRRKPTRQGRLAAIENAEKDVKSNSESLIVESESKVPAENSDLGVVDDDSDNLFLSPKQPAKAEPSKLDHKTQEKKKMNIMSQLISEVATSKVALRRTAVEKEDDENDFDIFSEAAKKDRSKSSFSFQPPEENGIASMFPIDKKEDEKVVSDVAKSDSFEDDFFTEPAFQNFKSSISHKDSILNMEDDDDDDDLFSAIKSNVLPKIKTEVPESKDLFTDDTDIFADIQKEKYEMFPNQVYDDDDDDDIFSNTNNSTKTINKTNSTATVKKVETQQVNAFDDPLTGLLGE